jgi:alpha-ketoglutarate-dependent 2,4-dichlorophenoxyacetate dioxygenase
MGLQLTPLGPVFAAQVNDVDLTQPLDPKLVEELIVALDQYGVLLFRGQMLSQEQLVKFGSQFGNLDSLLQKNLMDNIQKRLKYDTLTDISNVDEKGNVADPKHRQSLMNIVNRTWHSDGSFARVPKRYSILSAVAVVKHGGQTEYADMRAGYDTLDQPTKDLIADKVGEWWAFFPSEQLGLENYQEKEKAAYPPVRWPLVRVHPTTGRRVLWCDTKVRQIFGMEMSEGRQLVQDLIEHTTQRERVYSHTWQVGDLIIADNRSVLHRGRRFDRSERREMRRAETLDDSVSLPEGVERVEPLSDNEAGLQKSLVFN